MNPMASRAYAPAAAGEFGDFALTVIDGEKLTFQAGQGLAALEELAPAWRALAEAMPGARFNHFPEWYRAYVPSLEADPDRVWFVAAYRGGKLIAVCPLHFQDFSAGAFRPRILGTIDEDQMQLSDFTFEQTPENAGLLDELTRWLRGQRKLRWDELRLRKVSSESSIAYSARTRLPKWAVALEYHTSAFFRTDETYEELTKSLGSKFKSNLRRRNRIAEQTAPLRHQRYRSPDELVEAFALFLELEASGWKGAAGTSSAIRVVPEMLAFYTALVREFGARGACVINLLWHGDTAVAGQFCLQIGRTFYILKVGFSEPHAGFAPGILLLERILKESCEDPAVDVLHLVNEPPWAKFFRPTVTGVWSYFAPNWSMRGMLVHLGLLIKRRREAHSRKEPAGDSAPPESD
jgi:CelD/BcsL family acetyltransferase involved in cellulose biosynthesis